MQLKLTEIKANYYDAKYVNMPTGATPRVDTFAHYLEDILGSETIQIDEDRMTFVGEEDGVITIQVGTKQYIIDENGNVSNTDYNADYCGIRPAVYLGSRINIEEDEDGILHKICYN